MKIWLLFLLSLLAGLCFCSCTSNDIAGGTDVGNSDKIAGIAVDGKGVIQIGVEVVLIPDTYNPVNDTPLQDSNKQTTDSTGRYLFAINDQIVYNIELFNPDTKTRCLRTGICGEGLNVDFFVDTLKFPSVIKVILPSDVDTVSGYVYVEGTNIYKKVTSKTIYLDVVPSGMIPKIIYVSKLDNKVLIDSIIVKSNDTLSLAQVLFVTGLKYDNSFILVDIITGKLREFGLAVTVVNDSHLTVSDMIGMSAVIISPLLYNTDNVCVILKDAPIPLITMDAFTIVSMEMADTASDKNTPFGVMKKGIIWSV